MADPIPHEVDSNEDQRTTFDRLRTQCPVVRHEFRGWQVLRHSEVVDILHDPSTFSNAVSRHLSVPNGMDPPEHAAYRRLIEPFFTPARMTAFEPACRQIAARLSRQMTIGLADDFIADFARPFAAAVQCTFLGWPPSVEGTLQSWVQRNQAATRAGDRDRLAVLAAEFTDQIESLLAVRRDANKPIDADITSELMHLEIDGVPLDEATVVSILRNWTAGEVGTIAASVGALANYLAHDPELQRQLRDQPQWLATANEEILRLDGPLPANRRRATRSADVGGKRVAAGDTLHLIWLAANRDPAVFVEPERFRWDRDPDQNLLYGAGTHACPGAPLARLELRVAMEELLRATAWIEPAPDQPAARETWPAAGFARLPLRLTPQ